MVLSQVLPGVCELLLLRRDGGRLLRSPGAEGGAAAVPVTLPPLHLIRSLPGR